MPLYLKLISLIFGIIFFLIFLNLVKKRSVKPFYITSWLAVSIFMISVVIFEGIYKMVAGLLGLTDASFLVIVSLISFLLIYVLYLSIKISEISDRVQELISHNGILENHIKKLEKNENN